MAEKQVNINVVTKADKSEVVDLAENVDTLKDKAEEAGGALSEIGSDVDNSNIDELASSADDASSSLNDASSSAEDVASSAGNIEKDKVDAIGESADNARSMFDGLKDSIEGANDSMSLVDAMTGAELSGNIVSGFNSMTESAGDYADTMVRVGYAMSGTSMSAEQAEQKYGSMISSMAETTGRGAGAVRQHLVNMGNVGITNSQVLQDSFNAISKASFQMNNDIGMMDSAFQKMVLSGMAGKRQLSNFGISVKELGQAMGVTEEEATKTFQSLDENSRASVLATALNMKYGADVTNNYKNSFQHLSEELERAKGYFIRVVGEAILPTLIPAINTASTVINTLAKGFRGLPAPIKMIVGGAIGLTAGLTSAGLAISALIKMVGASLSPFMKLFNLLTGQNITSVVQFGKAMKTLGIEVLKAGASALKSAGMWVVQKAQLLASSIASGIATVKNWALAISEWAVASPIYIIIIAIVALIAILGYLYFNNEQVRQAIDGLGQTLMNVGQIMYTAIVNAVNWVIGALQNLWNYVITLGGLLPANVSLTGNQIVDTILRVLMFLATLPIQIGIIFINTIAKVLGFGNNFVQNMINAGSKSVSNFINYISQIPAKLGAELSNALNKVQEWASTLPQKFWEAGVNAVKNFLNALGIASPGTMQRMLVWEITEMGNRVPTESKKLLSNVNTLGSNIVDEFGNPELKMGIDETLNGSIAGENATGYGNQTININLEVGSVDNEERVQEIINIIRRELSWDNKTAGRSV